jgi:class 3 adenylate cyclase/predicted ATPase
MTFDEVLAQVLDLLQREGRVSYRALKRRFALDDDYLEDLKAEITQAKRLARDEDGVVLVWVGAAPTAAAARTETMPPAAPPVDTTALPKSPAAGRDRPEAERRQLTVLFCDVVDSTALAARLDPEDLRELIRAYQQACAEVIQRFEGHIAQYLGDGLMVYFGYPRAHEDDAQRAIRAGLEMVEAIKTLNTRLQQKQAIQSAIRVGIHTGVVVVGEIGGGNRREQLALGDTPNVAARIQGLAAPNTVLISAATHRLVERYLAYEDVGSPLLKGVSQPIALYRVLPDNGTQSRVEVNASGGLLPLVGREAEAALLLEGWAQSKDGAGRVVFLSGEPGIGKSRLVELLREHVAREGCPCMTFRCSPYHTNSALYPMIEHLRRLLQFHHDDTPEVKLAKLDEGVRTHRFSGANAVSLLAGLLSVPLPEGSYPPLNLSPQQQKQHTAEALTAWLVEEAGRQPLLVVYEDLHWADPSSLELLSLLMHEVATARMLMLLTFRPEFRPPWTSHSHITHLTLSRFTRPEVERMIVQVMHGKILPAEVIQQVMTKTDGVPLFIEELLKMILESGLLREEDGHYLLTGPLPPLAIPSTLQDSLMARLDRLAAVREIAQLASALGREFSYEVIQAVARMDEETLQHGLAALVDAELVYQRGRVPQATYVFKHALIRDAAYQSLLKSTRQLYHQQIAQVLEGRFPEIKEIQPELLAHHYTEAGLHTQAVAYWQQAGQHAIQRSAHVEAIAHLTQGLELLAMLPDTPERLQDELTCQLSLGTSLLATKGHAAPEVERAYARARRLCQQMGETPQLLMALQGLFTFYLGKAEFQTTRDLGEELLRRESGREHEHFLLIAHRVLASTHFYRGEFAPARQHAQEGLARYDPQRHRFLAFQYGQDVGVYCRVYAAWTLWMLGYADQALQHIDEALSLARDLSHPFSLAVALNHAAYLHHFRREERAAQERAEEAIALCSEQGFAFYWAMATVVRGRLLAAQPRPEDGIGQTLQGLSAWRLTGAVILVPTFLALLAESYGLAGQPEEGLTVLDEALHIAHTNGECWWQAELHRLKGEFWLIKATNQGHSGNGPGAPWSRTMAAQQAEICFRQSLDGARGQQAKALELRAAMSLSRLWQQQGRCPEAQQLLAPLYGWFTEGFDTADLQEAKVLLEELT